METNGEWIDCTALDYLVIDAMGVILDGVECARETHDGVEAMAIAITPEGNELVCSLDDGITFEPVRARMEIPGGMLCTNEEV